MINLILDEAWLSEFIKHKNVLLGLIKVYHPFNAQPNNMKITAPVAEALRKIICSEIIQKEYILDIETAIMEKNIVYLRKVLEDTWFGMPEAKEIRTEAFHILCEMIE